MEGVWCGVMPSGFTAVTCRGELGRKDLTGCHACYLAPLVTLAISSISLCGRCHCAR